MVDKEKKEIGRLVVVVLKAKSLPDKHTFSKQDPYAVIELSNSSTETTKEDRNGGQHPVWDEQFVMTVYDIEGEEQKLTVKVFAKEPGPHPLLGTGEVSIVPRKAEQWENNEFDDWVPLGQDGKYRGEVFLEMTWYPRQDLLPKVKPKPAGAKVPAAAKSLPRPSLAALPPQELAEAQQQNPVAWGLQRRKSKLDPKTRLGRPNIILGPTDEEPPSQGGPLPPRGSSIQPWADQSVNQPRKNSKPSAPALPLPGEPEPLPIPVWLQPALGQAAALPRARPHPPAQTQSATLDDVRILQQQQAPSRIEVAPWPAQHQQQPYGQPHLQSAPTPSPHLPGSYPYDRPVSPSGYGTQARQPYYPPATTANVYGTVPYPHAPVQAPTFDPNQHRFAPAPSPQFPHRHSAPYSPPLSLGRPTSALDPSFVPRPAPAPPVAPSPPSRPITSPPPMYPSPSAATLPSLSAQMSHEYRSQSPQRRSPSPPPPRSPPRARVRTPSPVRRERTPPPVRKPLPTPVIDERQASIYAQLQRQREQEERDARLAAEMAAEYDGQEERAESQRREMDELSLRTAQLMAASHTKSWEDEKREREEADAKMARDLALAEEVE